MLEIFYTIGSKSVEQSKSLHNIKTTFILIVILLNLWICQTTRILPFKKGSELCINVEAKRFCSLQSINGTWSGSKTHDYPNKFVLLWPMPYGNFEHARRVCEACDFQVAEIWDEDDHEQMMDLIKTKYNMEKSEKFMNASFWLGAMSKRHESAIMYDWTYQDGSTPVRFHHLRLPESWSNGNEAVPSGFPDKARDCIVIGPDSNNTNKIIWYIQSCDRETNFAVCQFKRKRHCYDETEPIPTTQLNLNLGTNETEIKTKPQPYYISNYPLTWRLAKETCEKDNRSLIFFQNEAEQTKFKKLILDHLSDKPQFLETGFWTAGKFFGNQQYDELAWWIQEDRIDIVNWKNSDSGEVKKNWGKDAYAKDQQEPYDASGNSSENCVYVKFKYDSKKPADWYTADCEKTQNFFICRDDNIELEKKSSVEYCEAGKYVKKEMQDCNSNLILKKQKPGCVCVKGLHGLTDHESCNTRLLVGDKCVKLNAKGVVHWKILSPEMVSNKNWLIAQYRNQKSGRFIEWFNMKMNSTRQLFGHSNVYFSGLKAYQIGKNQFCFTPTVSNPEEYYEIKIRNETSKITFAKSCSNGELNIQELNGRQHKVGKNGIDECAIKTCKKPVSSEQQDNLISSKCAGNEECALKSILENKQKRTTTIRPEVLISNEIESKNSDINENMLSHSIDTSFYNITPAVDISKVQPKNSWRILEKLFTIVKNICSCMVPPDFLDNALELFKVAHHGSSYEYQEFFSPTEESDILQMLGVCESTSKTDKGIMCQRNSCNNRVSQINFLTIKGESVEKRVDDTGYQGIQHHHIMETVWNVIDVWNVACIKEFKQSYLLYHHLEQGMENLYTEELRKLWHFPNVDGRYFQMILGPLEATYLMNLRHCVDGVYQSNPKVLRLSRPKSSTQNQLGNKIRQRKIKEHEIATGYSDIDNELSGNVNASSSPVFCSRDQYCMKW